MSEGKELGYGELILVLVAAAICNSGVVLLMVSGEGAWCLWYITSGGSGGGPAAGFPSLLPF